MEQSGHNYNLLINKMFKMTEFILKLNDEDIKILNTALVNLPFGQVANLIAKLQLQINEQSKKVDD